MTCSIPQCRLSFSVSLLMAFLLGNIAPVAARGDDLPSGEEVLREYTEATGGQAAYDAITNRMFTATLEIVNAGVVLDITTYAAKPNKLIAVVESAATGKIKKGCTGELAWSLSDMQGPVVEQGAALENQLRDSLFDRLVYWKTAYQSAKCTGIEDVDGKECYQVVLTPRPYKSDEAKDAELSILTVYVDTTSHLAIKIESNVVTEAGTIDVVAYLSDYKSVDGIMIPHQTKMELVGQTRVMKIESIQHNVELADDQFDPPVEVQEILSQQ